MYGMRYTAAGDASLMITFNPIITALLAIPFLGEKIPTIGAGLIIAPQALLYSSYTSKCRYPCR